MTTTGVPTESAADDPADGALPDRLPMGFYYGEAALDRLTRFERVVLQPNAYRPAELAQLRAAGTQPIAYLSLSEDVGPPAPWQRPERNPDWGGAMVVMGDERWVAHVVAAAEAALDAGFTGLFLDQLNVEFTYPEDLPDLLALITTLRALPRSGYVMANRGFAMLPELAAVVDGILFESFSTCWTADGYARWPDDVLDYHGGIAAQLHVLGVDVVALDYAETGDLAEFARARAARYVMPCFVSNKLLSQV
jgi:hypothetical protein